MINLKIPFYEVGRISRIVEVNNFYIVDRYGVNEKEIKTFSISKKDKNLNMLLKNYYDDLQGYLNFNNIKLENYKNNCFKSIQYMKNFRNIKYIALVLALLPLIGGVLESTTLVTLGIFLDVVFIPAFFWFDFGARKYSQEERKYNFVKEYANYKKAIEIYNKEKVNKKGSPTKYSKVAVASMDRNKVINKVKVNVKDVGVAS